MAFGAGFSWRISLGVLFGKRLFASFHETKSGELPAQRWMKIISIAHPTMPRRGGHRRAAKNLLIDHEFAIILAQRPRSFDKAGVGKIGALAPLPATSPVELGLGGFPFKFSWQTHAFPLRECCSLIIGNMGYGCLRSKFCQAR